MSRDALVQGYTLFVGDPGSVGVDAGDDGGLYHRDTRHLSELSTTIDGVELDVIGRDLTDAGTRTVVATDGNAAVNRVDEHSEKRSDLVVETAQTVTDDTGLTQSTTVTNHSAVPFAGSLAVGFDVDFADVFEVRGYASRLERDPDVSVGDSTVTYTYDHGTVDGETVTRRTVVEFESDPARIASGEATFELDLASQERTTVEFRVRPEVSVGAAPADGGGTLTQGASAQADDLPANRSATDDRPATPSIDLPAVETGDPDYDRVFARAGQDLAALTGFTEHGPVPLAGAPWFATVFGRDSLIAAYQALPVAPSLARGTLRYLAAHQGTTVDDAREEEPGKMFHEIRDGELALRGRVPHSPYYGSVDATPLWVLVLRELHRWTGDDEVVADLEGALDAALSWIDRARAQYGDDPFLYYEESPTMGLLHKAWRDTPGSVQFPDGETADPPIASVEVQGYVYRALRDAADLYETVLDRRTRARDLREEADRFADAFDDAYWLPDAGYYGVALDGDGTVVPTLTSNVGHCLWAGVVPEDRAKAVARTLQSEELFSGWGLRTMSTETAGYSPISYHLGSVWPHDTSLTALGLARYGFHDDADRLTRAVMDACTHFPEYRIPELFCGFADDLEPKPYASSCVPQAWSAGAPYAFLRATFAVEPESAGDGGEVGTDGVHVGNDDAVLDASALDPLRQRWSD
jgi:glycogen debranching enzyme